MGVAHRFQHGQAEPLDQGRVDERLGAVGQNRQVIARHHADHAHASALEKMAAGAVQICENAILIGASHVEGVLGSCLLTEEVEGSHDSGCVLVINGRANVQDVWPDVGHEVP